MTLNNAIKGMQIIAKYAKGDARLVDDQAYIVVDNNGTRIDVSAEDYEELTSLGWTVYNGIWMARS